MPSLVSFLQVFLHAMWEGFQDDRDFTMLFAIVVLSLFLAVVLSGIVKTVPHPDDDDDEDRPVR